MTVQSDRRWAELARMLEFGQLQELRKQSEGWRTGLTALTGLLAALAVLKGRDNLADLSPTARYLAMGLTAGAFLLLLTGSVYAIRASHGRPGAKILLSGQALRKWTESEIRRVGRSLQVASTCCVMGIVLVTSGVAVTWLSTSPPANNVVQVKTTDAVLCGKLLYIGPTGVKLQIDADNQTLVTIPIDAVDAVTPTQVC